MNKLRRLFVRRGFELIEGMNGELPVKATIHSAGVDFIASADIVIPAFRFKSTATCFVEFKIYISLKLNKRCVIYCVVL